MSLTLEFNHTPAAIHSRKQVEAAVFAAGTRTGRQDTEGTGKNTSAMAFPAGRDVETYFTCDPGSGVSSWFEMRETSSRSALPGAVEIRFQSGSWPNFPQASLRASTDGKQIM